MVKKLEKLASSVTENQLVSSVVDSANQIWLAGLGAFAKAQDEGVKLFETLVKEGEAVQERARKVAGDRMDEVTTKATDAWGKIEKVFEGRVANALEALNVPSKKDVDALAKRVSELTAVVEKLTETGEKPEKVAAPRAKANPTAAH
jgi:poly(hydroxyalkanoate) granule-associated protein